ncbi:sodium:calcium antiporter, partial [Patescibacteria group bacterium]
MLLDIILFVLGFVFLIKGADLLVEGSSSIAKKHGISNLVIGLTIVAFGTSAPELIVSSVAAFRGSTGVALGNIIGSNIANTLLILGVAAVINALIVKKTTVNKEIPLSLLAV